MTTEIKYYTKEEAIQVVSKAGLELKNCSPELRNNAEVVRAALKQHGWAFCYASRALKSNKAFIMKAIHENVEISCLMQRASMSIKSDIEVMTLAIEKSNNGLEFAYAQGEVAFNKELAAKALVKWGVKWGASDLGLWKNLYPTLQEFFPKDSWYETAQAYLIQLEQEKQAELVTGGSTAEDEVVW